MKPDVTCLQLAGAGVAGEVGALGDACHRLATESKLSNYEIIYHIK